MKIFAVSGLSKTGKTTVIESLATELSHNGYSVAVIKHTDCKDLSLERESADTARQRKAGAISTILLGPSVTAIIHKRRLGLVESLGQLRQDVIILEGFGRLNIPKIVTAASFCDADARYCNETYAFSGIIAAQTATYRNIPVINCFSDPAALAEISLEHALRNTERLTSVLGEDY